MEERDGEAGRKKKTIKTIELRDGVSFVTEESDDEGTHGEPSEDPVPAPVPEPEPESESLQAQRRQPLSQQCQTFSQRQTMRQISRHVLEHHWWRRRGRQQPAQQQQDQQEQQQDQQDQLQDQQEQQQGQRSSQQQQDRQPYLTQQDQQPAQEQQGQQAEEVQRPDRPPQVGTQQRHAGHQGRRRVKNIAQQGRFARVWEESEEEEENPNVERGESSEPERGRHGEPSSSTPEADDDEGVLLVNRASDLNVDSGVLRGNAESP